MIKIKKSVLKVLQKALNEQPKTLNYFKKEFINILKKQYDELDKKESKEKSFEKSIMLYAGDVFIKKGRAANIGEVREWKGRKFKKIAQGKWRPIYESASRGAKQSIKILAKKISKVNSTDELMEIIMQNVNRFQDENGKILPIVEELKNAVNEKKRGMKELQEAPKPEENNKYTENYKPKSIEDWDSANNLNKRLKDGDKVHNILDKNKKAIQEKLSKINLTKVDGEFINTKATNIRIKESSKLWKEYIGENEPDSLKEIKKLWEEESKKYFNEKYKEKAEKEIVEIPDEKLLSLKEEYEDLPTIDDSINGFNINEYCKGGYTRTLGMNNSTKRAVLKKHYLLPMIENEIKKRKLDSQEAPKTEEKPVKDMSIEEMKKEIKDIQNNSHSFHVALKRDNPRYAELVDTVEKKEKEAKENAEKKEHDDMIQGVLSGKNKWNGKIYGNEKYGYRIYVDNKEISVSNEEIKDLENFKEDKRKKDIEKKANEKENETKKVENAVKESAVNHIVSELNYQIENFSLEAINKQAELIQNKPDKFKTFLKKYISSINFNEELFDVDYDKYQKNPYGIENKNEFIANSLDSIFENIKNKTLDKLNQAKEKKEYDIKMATDEKFRESENKKKAAKNKEIADKNKKQADRIKEIAGEGYWNGKVYGSAKNGYSIYVKNKKYTIPESDYELFDLKKSFSERISEILKSLK